MATVHKPSNSELEKEADILRIKNKNLEEANLKLYGIIERLREEIDTLHKDAAGVDL